MKYQKTKNEMYIVKIEQGESAIETLTQFCVDHSISNASVVGIGAVDRISCGYYDLPSKQYHFTEYRGMYEVVSATGNVMLKEGKPFVHLHAVFSDTENNTFGGHVEEMRVGLVLEVTLMPLASDVSRTKDTDIGLYLMDM